MPITPAAADFNHLRAAFGNVAQGDHVARYASRLGVNPPPNPLIYSPLAALGGGAVATSSWRDVEPRLPARAEQ
jgi:hypothetical protein